MQGKHYHISALYVVDLERFRSLRAGDHLRGVYSDMAGDQGSLSNLDQDLPSKSISVYVLLCDSR